VVTLISTTGFADTPTPQEAKAPGPTSWSTMQVRSLATSLLPPICSAAKRAGGRIVLVDAASDDAREFYERHDFERLPGHTHRLVMKLSSVANALGVPWP
jgi:hypothetical protein